ncbi:DUF1003 domain-containing protein [Rhodococcus sp. D2-41]|uniref:DUF1003 domain-containing protein n=1 Tax=Speluncibacter jeojiensis TaxID=2710754 RepID=UPI00240FDA3C|nr:DUF1003 domain-containing protein [Rhodococcus sp. D2-41]MDG3012392.1 DUF1003 domain-containing protein [Rhodococcus sp. D2-41]
MKPALWHRHPAVRSGEQLTFGERAADRAVAAMGSWSFIWGQTAVIVVWMILNTVAWCTHWDPFPWILLNLVFSTQAAYAAPLVLLASRRADQKSSERAELDLDTDREALALLRRIDAKLNGGAS